MIPSPVQSGSWPITNGTAMPASPGARKRSPSSAIPWTAIATSPTSAVCRCTAMSARERRGWRETRPAIARPTATDSVMQSSATIPAAREASHHPCSAGSGPFMLRAPRAASSGSGPTGSGVPSAWIARPPPRARIRRAPSGPESSAALLSVSASSVVGASAVTASRPVQAGSPVAGSSRWCALRPAAVRHARRTMLEVATAPPSSARRAAGARSSGCATAISCTPPTRTSPPASTTHERAEPSSRATRSAAWPLPEPPRSRRSPGGRSIAPLRSSTCTWRQS